MRWTWRLGVLRSAIGAGMIAAPSLLARSLGADRRTAQRLGYLTRMVGVREIALGAGSIEAVRRGDDPRPWLLAQGASDSGDALSIAVAVARGRVSRPMGLVVIVFALGGVAFDSWVHVVASRAQG